MTIQYQAESYRNYRTRFLLDVALPVIVLPLISSVAAVHVWNEYSQYPLALWKRFPVYFVSIIGWNVIQGIYSDWQESREARRLGARMIPRLKTGWPGNSDIIWKQAFKPRQEYLFQDLEKMMKETGGTTVNLRILWGNQIISIDESVVKFVLATGFEHFDKGVRQKMNMETFLGNGIFNRDGDIWRQHRATTRPFFARERITDFDHFETFTVKTLAIMNTIPRDEAMDLQDIFSRFTLDTASAFLFNTEMDTLSLPLPKAGSAKLAPKGSLMEGEFGEFATAFEEAQLIINNRARMRQIWPLFELFRDKSLTSTKAVHDWLDPIVEQTLKKTEKLRESGTKASGEETSFLEYLAMSTDDKDMIREELLNILLASRDTTASMLSSVVYLFTQYPEVLSKLREEVLSFCPGDTAPTYEAIRDMKYLRAVLNETLRLFPPVPGNGRASRDRPVLIPTSTTSDWSEPKDMRPMYMPANTIISYAPFTIHRREDLWGEDAHEFDPMRWLNDGTGRLERMVKNPLMFVPFNAGPRICLGQQFALTEGSYILIRLLQVYDGFELDPSAQPEGSLPPEAWKKVKHGRAPREKVWHQSALTMYIKGGLWVKMHKAESV